MTNPLGSPASDVLRSSNDLMERVLPLQPALACTRLLTMNRSRVEVPMLSLGKPATFASPPPGSPAPESTWRSLVLVSSRLCSPWEVTEEFFADNPDIDDEMVVDMMVSQIGNDLQDLAFNGDEESQDELLIAQDGWLKRMARRRHWTLRRRPVRARELVKALDSLHPRVRADRSKLRFFVSMDTYLDLLDAEADRPAPEHLTLNDVPVLAVPLLDKSHALVTQPKNLVLGVEREYKVRKTTEGRDAIERDSRLYAAHLRVALQVQDPTAGFHIEARPWHTIFGRVGAFTSKRYARAKRHIQWVVWQAKNRRQARKEAAQDA